MTSNDGPPILALIARKGGVGKSMLATLLARIYAKSGLHVLLVDLDPQGTATEVLVPERAPNTELLGELLSAGGSLLPLICNSASERLALVPTSERLTIYETQLSSHPMGVVRVRRSLESLREADCDLVVVDTPPTLGAFTFGALAAATWALIPTFCEEPSIRTLPSAFATVSEVQALNPALRVLAVVANRLDRRTRYGLGALETLRAAFPEHLAKTVIPAAAAIADCMRPGAAIEEDTTAAGAIVELAEELLGRMTVSRKADSITGTAAQTLDCSDCNAVDDSNRLKAVND